MTHKPVAVFTSSRGNRFMYDIGTWLVEAAALAGRRSELVVDELPDDPGTINLVVAPHEFFALQDHGDDVLNAAASLSVPVATEQPGTPWFHIAGSYARVAPLVLDINRRGAAKLERQGHRVRFLQLGGTPLMRAPATERDLDVLFLGGDTPHRQAALAPLGPVLADRRAELRLFRWGSPVHGGTPGVVFGEDKYALLARARILVNVHRDHRSGGYFEWARMVEAMANGCTVVTEPSTGFAPLVDGEHFLATTDLAGTVSELLDDPERCAALGTAAAAAVNERFPLDRALLPILDELDGIDVADHRRRRAPAIRRNRIRRAHTIQVFPPFRPAAAQRERVYHALLDEMRLRREIDAARCLVLHGEPDHVARHTTPAHDRAVAAGHVPEVSVVVTLYNYAALVPETIESLLASRDVDAEIVVVDDHSSDDGRAVVTALMEAHPDAAILLLGRDDNQGLAAARNLGIEHARADKLMIVDADNLVYPACLRRLADALDADPAAAFAYATLEAFGVTSGLRSHLGWSPRWLCEFNYLDAQAMVRRSTYERHGGYRTGDDFVYGWEDWDLWLRLAAAGEHGVHVPQPLGRYRTQESSMITITNLAADIMRDHVKARYATLPWSD